jgi:hypothetical protein
VNAATHRRDDARDGRQALHVSDSSVSAPLERSQHEVGHSLGVGAAKIELDVGDRAGDLPARARSALVRTDPDSADPGGAGRDRELVPAQGCPRRRLPAARLGMKASEGQLAPHPRFQISEHGRR